MDVVAARWWTANHLLVVLNGVLAIAATATAVAAVRTIKSSNRVAKAAEKQVEATNELVRESQFDRELAWSPMVAVTVVRGQMDAGGVPGRYERVVTITNLGKGIASECYYIARDGESWCWLQHLGLKGEETTPMPLTTLPGSGDAPWELLEPGPTDKDQNDRLADAFFCKDVFGNRIRFGRTRDVSRPGDENPPAWAPSPIVWSR